MILSKLQLANVTIYGVTLQPDTVDKILQKHT